MRLSDAKTNGACKTKTMLKLCMFKHDLVYGARPDLQNMYPCWRFLRNDAQGRCRGTRRQCTF